MTLKIVENIIPPKNKIRRNFKSRKVGLASLTVKILTSTPLRLEHKKPQERRKPFKLGTLSWLFINKLVGHFWKSKRSTLLSFTKFCTPSTPQSLWPWITSLNMVHTSIAKHSWYTKAEKSIFILSTWEQESFLRTSYDSLTTIVCIWIMRQA